MRNGDISGNTITSSKSSKTLCDSSADSASMISSTDSSSAGVSLLNTVLSNAFTGMLISYIEKKGEVYVQKEDVLHQTIDGLLATVADSDSHSHQDLRQVEFVTVFYLLQGLIAFNSLASFIRFGIYNYKKRKRNTLEGLGVGELESCSSFLSFFLQRD